MDSVSDALWFLGWALIILVVVLWLSEQCGEWFSSYWYAVRVRARELRIVYQCGPPTDVEDLYWYRLLEEKVFGDSIVDWAAVKEEAWRKQHRQSS